MSYQGPNTIVRQNFETNPPAVTVEQLPSALIGTAYEVHKDENLLSYDGIDANLSSTDADWVIDGSNKVIYSSSQGEKIYNFYPPAFKVLDSENGGIFDIEDPGTADADGTQVSHKDTYEILSITSSTKAYIPYFHSASGATLANTSKRVECSDGRFLDAKLMSGLRVTSATAVVGYVDYVESNTALYLKANSLLTGAKAYVYFGESIESGAVLSAKASYLYDPNTNFTRLGIKRGDMVSSAVSLGLSATISKASIVAIISDNLVEIFAGDPQMDANYDDADAIKPVTLDKAYSSKNSAITFTASVTGYDIVRFIGFTEKYSACSSAGAAITASISSTALILSAVPYNAKSDDGGVAYDLEINDTIVVNGVKYTIISGSGASYVLDKAGTETTEDVLIFKSSDTAGQIVNDLLADYRAVMVANNGTVFKSSDYQLIGTGGIFGVASVYNDLAFMIQTVSGVNGNRVLYAISVDPTEDIVTEYSEALEALKFFDVYSHAFGSSEAGVNALGAPYVNEQSNPYEAHERIVTLAYDKDDTYLLGSGAGTISSGVITSSGVNLVTIGLALGDKVRFIDGSSVEHDRNKHSYRFKRNN